MKKSLFFFLLLIVTTLQVRAGNPIRDWGTYLPGYLSNPYNQTVLTATDKFGYVYVVSSSDNYIQANNYIPGYDSYVATPGSYQPAYGGGSTDVYLIKFDRTGQRVWSTYYGGAGDEMPSGIVCDADGNVYVSGYTTSDTGIANVQSHQPTIGSAAQDGFLVKFDTAGHRLWGTYYGGTGTDAITDVSCTADGNVFIVGYTTSKTNITTPNCFQDTLYTYYDLDRSQIAEPLNLFVAKFNSAGQRQWGTYYEGASDAAGSLLIKADCDAEGNIYVGSTTDLLTGIATPGAYQDTATLDPYQFSANKLALLTTFIVKFNTNGQRSWGTYYGYLTEQNKSRLWDLKTDVAGNFYIAGTTEGGNSSELATPGAMQALSAGEDDIFLAKFDSTGHRVWGTYYGGANIDHPYNITSDASCNLYVTGVTSSMDNMASPDGYDTSFGRGVLDPAFADIFPDAFLLKMDSTGHRKWGTFYGGLGSRADSNPQDSAFCQDAAFGVACDLAGNIYISGLSDAIRGLVTPGSLFDTIPFPSFLASSTSFLTKFHDCDIFPATTISPSGSIEFCQGDSIQLKTGSANNISYEWKHNDQTINNATGAAYTVRDSGTYKVILSGNGGLCKDSSGIDTVTVNPLPSPVITVVNNNTLSTGVFTSYQWNKENTPIPGATNQILTMTGPGIYTVTVTDANTCAATSQSVSLSVGNVSLQQEIQIFPNPATSMVHITAPISVSVILQTMDGKTVWTQSNVTSIDVAPLPEGVYLLKLTDDKGQTLKTEKLIKTQH